MKKLIALFAASMMLLSVGAQANSCPDDPRLDDVRSLIKAVKKGEAIEPLQMQYGTYLDMNDKIKAFIGGGEGNPNFKIVDAGCEEPIIIDGEMITQYEMPIEEIIKYLTTMQAKGDSDGIDDLIKNVKAKDVSVEELFDWFSLKSYDSISEATTCQLTEAGVVSFGYQPKGKLKLYKNCRGKDGWNYPTKIDLYAGFGGQIPGKKKQVLAGFIDQCCGDRMYMQILSEKGSVKKSTYFLKGKTGKTDAESYAGNMMSLVINLPKLNAGMQWETFNNESTYDSTMNKMLARHNAIIAGSDELGEDDGSEKE